MSQYSTKAGITSTICHMYKRELQREAEGQFQKSQLEVLWTFLLIVTFSVLVGAVVYKADSFAVFLDSWQNFGFITLMFPIAVFIILKLSLVLRWVFYWLLVATALLFLLNSFKLSDNLAKWVFIGLVVIECITIFVYLIIRLVYPKVMSYMIQRDTLNFWGVREHQLGIFSRRATFGRRQRFSYNGEVNELNQPHGFGTWTSEWMMGEILTGYWQNGFPLGPFKSQEYRTGYSFSNLRIGIVATDAAGFRNMSLERTNKLMHGVVSVECSTAGKFFSDLPRVLMILDPFLGNFNINNTRANLVHFDDLHCSTPRKQRIVLTFDPKDGLSLEGYTRISRCASKSFKVSCITEKDLIFSGELVPGVSLEGWEKVTVHEALLYVPGYNCTLEEASKTLGQMLTLGNMPSKIKPFIFGWPGGSLFQYQRAIKQAMSPNTTKDFLRTIAELIEGGFSKIHILSHSLGARVVLAACDQFEDYFVNKLRSVSIDDIGNTKKAELSTITFMNPEAPLDLFKEKQFKPLKDLTDIISVYANFKDVALFASEIFFTRKAMLGRRVHEFVLDDCIESQPPISDEESSNNSKNCLDMDIIDTTEIDSNVHAARHSYFDLNKIVVDDVTDIICNCVRAVERRHRLLHIKNNVYGFLSAPSFIVK